MSGLQIEMLEKIKEVFEKYIDTDPNKDKVVFYIPNESPPDPNSKNREPIVRVFHKSFYDQDGCFPYIFFQAIKSQNHLYISNRLVGVIDDRIKQRIVSEMYVEPCFVFNPNAWMGHNIGLLKESLEKTSQTSLLMHLIDTYETLIERKPDATFESEKNVSPNDYKKYRCIQTTDKKYINLKDNFQIYLKEATERGLGFFVKNGEFYTENGKPSLSSVMAFLDVQPEIYPEVKEHIEKGEGLQRVQHDHKRENQGLNNIPQPKPQNQSKKDNKNRKGGGGKRK